MDRLYHRVYKIQWIVVFLLTVSNRCLKHNNSSMYPLMVKQSSLALQGSIYNQLRSISAHFLCHYTITGPYWTTHYKEILTSS